MKKSTAYSWASAACFAAVTVPPVAYMLMRDWRALLWVFALVAVFATVCSVIVLGIDLANRAAKARENGQ